MKILVYTDNHYCQYSSIIRSRGEKYSKRLENQIQTLNWIEETAMNDKCDMIVCLGDFFDKAELNAEEITALTDIKWSNIPHKFLVGNHEMGTNDLVYNSTNILSKIGEIIYQPKLDSIFGCDILYLPYILESNRKPLAYYIEKATKEYYAGNFTTDECRNFIIFSHNDISGIEYGFHTSKIGFDINEINNSCQLYLNGHLHNQTQVSSKILNLGNVTGQNFSEDASKYEHCIAILDTNTLSVDLIVNPYAFNFYKFEVTSIEELNNKLQNILDNAIISLKASSSILSECRKILDNDDKVNEYRAIMIPELSNIKIEQSELTKLDHIEEFKKYILNNIDNSEELLDELSLL